MHITENIPISLAGDTAHDCAVGKPAKKTADGDSAAFTQLYECLKRPVFLLAYSILQDYALAEDATQETFLRAAEKADTFRPGTNPKAWIFTIARNLAIDLLRKRKKEAPLDSLPEAAQQSPENSAAAVAEATDGLARALAVLEPHERDLVILRIEAELPHRDIAKILGISAVDARVRYFRALKKLKKYYEKKP
jgi:RNA polymerase sigma-70 factor, ECF subfamily